MSNVGPELLSSREAMARHDTDGEFVSEREDWSLYIEQLENYFVANNVVTGEKKRAILLSVCGACTYKLIGNLITPVTPWLKSYEYLVKLVREHYSFRRSEIQLSYS